MYGKSIAVVVNAGMGFTVPTPHPESLKGVQEFLLHATQV